MIKTLENSDSNFLNIQQLKKEIEQSGVNDPNTKRLTKTGQPTNAIQGGTGEGISSKTTPLKHRSAQIGSLLDQSPLVKNLIQDKENQIKRLDQEIAAHQKALPNDKNQTELKKKIAEHAQSITILHSDIEGLKKNPQAVLKQQIGRFQEQLSQLTKEIKAEQMKAEPRPGFFSRVLSTLAAPFRWVSSLCFSSKGQTAKNQTKLEDLSQQAKEGESLLHTLELSKQPQLRDAILIAEKAIKLLSELEETLPLFESQIKEEKQSTQQAVQVHDETQTSPKIVIEKQSIEIQTETKPETIGTEAPKVVSEGISTLESVPVKKETTFKPFLSNELITLLYPEATTQDAGSKIPPTATTGPSNMPPPPPPPMFMGMPPPPPPPPPDKAGLPPPPPPPFPTGQKGLTTSNKSNVNPATAFNEDLKTFEQLVSKGVTVHIQKTFEDFKVNIDTTIKNTEDLTQLNQKIETAKKDIETAIAQNEKTLNELRGEVEGIITAMQEQVKSGQRQPKGSITEITLPSGKKLQIDKISIALSKDYKEDIQGFFNDIESLKEDGLLTEDEYKKLEGIRNKLSTGQKEFQANRQSIQGLKKIQKELMEESGKKRLPQGKSPSASTLRSLVLKRETLPEALKSKWKDFSYTSLEKKVETSKKQLANKHADAVKQLNSTKEKLKPLNQGIPAQKATLIEALKKAGYDEKKIQTTIDDFEKNCEKTNYILAFHGNLFGSGQVPKEKKEAVPELLPALTQYEKAVTGRPFLTKEITRLEAEVKNLDPKNAAQNATGNELNKQLFGLMAEKELFEAISSLNDYVKANGSAALKNQMDAIAKAAKDGNAENKANLQSSFFKALKLETNDETKKELIMNLCQLSLKEGEKFLDLQTTLPWISTFAEKSTPGNLSKEPQNDRIIRDLNSALRKELKSIEETNKNQVEEKRAKTLTQEDVAKAMAKRRKGIADDDEEEDDDEEVDDWDKDN